MSEYLSSYENWESNRVILEMLLKEILNESELIEEDKNNVIEMSITLLEDFRKNRFSFENTNILNQTFMKSIYMYIKSIKEERNNEKIKNNFMIINNNNNKIFEDNEYKKENELKEIKLNELSDKILNHISEIDDIITIDKPKDIDFRDHEMDKEDNSIDNLLENEIKNRNYEMYNIETTDIRTQIKNELQKKNENTYEYIYENKYNIENDEEKDEDINTIPIKDDEIVYNKYTYIETPKFELEKIGDDINNEIKSILKKKTNSKILNDIHNSNEKEELKIKREKNIEIDNNYINVENNIKIDDDISKYYNTYTISKVSIDKEYYNNLLKYIKEYYGEINNIIINHILYTCKETIIDNKYNYIHVMKNVNDIYDKTMFILDINKNEIISYNNKFNKPLTSLLNNSLDDLMEFYILYPKNDTFDSIDYINTITNLSITYIMETK